MKIESFHSFLKSLFGIREKPMFAYGSFELSGPICRCRKQNLSWSVLLDKKRGFDGIRFKCDTCGVYLNIPKDQSLMAIKCRTPYPGVQKEKKVEEPKQKPDPTDVKEDGNVLHFQFSDNEN